MSVYIIKKNNQLISFYYGENKAIYMQKLNKNQVYKTKVIENVLEYFSVALDKKGKIYIFCQDDDKNLKIAISSGENFKISNLFQIDTSLPEKVKFTPLFFGENISIVFNSYAEERRNNYISIKTLLQGKEWTKTENIDVFYLGGNNFFQVQKLNDSDLIMVYEKREKDIQLGYKEIINGKISNFTPLHRTGYQIVDFSFLALKGAIHFLYIVKNLFSSQIIYRKKDARGLSSPIVLNEGQNIRDCAVFFSEDSLYCSYTINSMLVYSASKDFGESFSSILNQQKTFSQDIIKASFLTNTEEKTYLNQVYVDYKNPLNIQFLPEICPEYINSSGSNFSNNTLNTDSRFISDLSNQNIAYIDNIQEKTEGTPQINTREFETNREETKIPLTNQMENTFRKYRVVTNEGDFMDQFNPKLFEEMMKKQTQQQNQRQNNLATANMQNGQRRDNSGNIENLKGNEEYKQNIQGEQVNYQASDRHNVKENEVNKAKNKQNEVQQNLAIESLKMEKSTFVNPSLQSGLMQNARAMQPDVELTIEQNLEYVKNKLEIANEQLEEKSQQLIKLNALMQEKNEERDNLRQEIKNLEKENKKLKETEKLNEKNGNEESEVKDERESKKANDSKKE